MRPPPADDLLRELGRLTWAAMSLEVTVYTVCRFIKPRHGPYDDWPISSRIDEALDDLATCPDDGMRAIAEAWLTEARAALKQRNEVLHSTPVVRVEVAEGRVVVTGEEWLTHFPRKEPRSAVDTRLSVEGLAPLCKRMEDAEGRWVELVTHPWACYPGNSDRGGPT